MTLTHADLVEPAGFVVWTSPSPQQSWLSVHCGHELYLLLGILEYKQFRWFPLAFLGGLQALHQWDGRTASNNEKEKLFIVQTLTELCRSATLDSMVLQSYPQGAGVFMQLLPAPLLLKHCHLRLKWQKQHVYCAGIELSCDDGTKGWEKRKPNHSREQSYHDTIHQAS